MRMTVYYMGPNGSNESFGEITLQGLTGQKALGHHRLIFNFYFATSPKPSDAQYVRLTDLRCEVEVTGPGGLALPLGFLTSGGHPVLGELYDRSRGSGFTAVMYLEADSRRLKALDDLRNGGGLRLSMKLVPETLCDGRRCGQLVELRRELNQSDCIELLRNAGFADRELIEVPSPEAMEGDDLRKAVEDLRSAANHLRTGQWRTTVGACRDSIEALSTALNDGEQVKKANAPDEDLFRDLRTMSKEERLRVLRRTFMVLTAAAHHRDQNGLSIDWTPADARAAVAIASAIVSLYSPAS